MSRRRVTWWVAVGVVAQAALLSSCGLPGAGSVREVEADAVPYGLLDPGSSSPQDDSGVPASGPGPLVYWLVKDDRLAPTSVEGSCAAADEQVVEGLLTRLAAGPTAEERGAGRDSALSSDSVLAVVELSQGQVEVEVEPETTISPERLPVAVGQIVLSLTSLTGVDAVAFVNDATPVSVPLPDGVLTDDPVTAADYDVLVPERFAGRDDLGCPAS